MPAEKLLEEIREKMARVGEVAPDIPESVLKEYKIKFKDGDTKKPIIANGIDKIVVFKADVVPQGPVIRVLPAGSVITEGSRR